MNDPGWREAWRGMWWRILLPIPQITMRAEKQMVSLVLVRRLYILFLETLALFGLVTFVALADPSPDAGSEIADAVFIGGFVVFALVTFGVGTHMLRSQRLTAAGSGSSEEIAATYRSTFFLGVAFAEATALVSFIIAFQAAEPLYYALGVVLSAPMWFVVAPTVEHVRRDDEITRNNGSVSLLTVLTTQPPPAL